MAVKQKRIVLTITNDANYDQRMIRICTSLHNAGYDVLLISRRWDDSKPLIDRPFKQRRVRVPVNQGKLFYLLYSLRLFFILLFIKADAFCAIDLDTILPVYYASRIRRMPRVYDAHELFTEMEECVSRPYIHKMWLWIERHTVPNFPYGYTVSESYVEEYARRRGVHYALVRNATILKPFIIPERPEKIILYQGTVNKGRCFEELIPAMKQVDAKLIVCGGGNFLEESKALVRQHGLDNKITFAGFVAPAELGAYTRQATIGITLFVATSLSNELSLANRFFDYMHHAVPQLAPAYPEYQRINAKYEVALLIPEVTEQSVADALNNLLRDKHHYRHMQDECMKARAEYCWQREEERLLEVWKNVFAHGDAASN